MCGVPYHAAHTYIARLINKGYKVAICDQMEDPSQAKGIVKRDVTRVITPGTVIEPDMLDEKKNNYIMAIYCQKVYFGLAAADISTGEFYTTQITWGSSMKKLIDEVSRYKPSEIIVNHEFAEKDEYKSFFIDYLNIHPWVVGDDLFDLSDAELRIKQIAGDNPLSSLDLAQAATGALISYLEETQKIDLKHIERISTYKIEEYMMIDSASRRNLEITETMRDDRKRFASLGSGQNLHFNGRKETKALAGTAANLCG